MDIGEAVKALKEGHRVARLGWNGKGMWLAYMGGMELPPYSTQGTDRKVNDRTAQWIGEDTPLVTDPYIAMWTAGKTWQPGWLASQQDLLATDWVKVPRQPDRIAEPTKHTDTPTRVPLNTKRA